ncbi:S-adenosyl-L-methionine-dependent methyltransferase [Venturia nashicola]|uniref:S-adenosyl-L-methionine-dependent methyltransferase n=1 Tax=Venturia nashicola TaxID=86259 RepID=A0A4Z1NU85_9PEZI|nr:S-adenosyl-L-methionine-dependent methyltransferase [Venturia nashicola]
MSHSTNISASVARPVPDRKPVPGQPDQPTSEHFGYYSGPSSLHSLNAVSSFTVNTTASGYTPSSTSNNATVTQATAGPTVEHVSVANLQSITGEDTNEEGEAQDVDSAYDSESLIQGDTMTLASYITDYRFEHGRRYHAYRDGAYWGPNDDHANEQQDLAHHMYNLTLNRKLYLAPITIPHNILDLGTGTGIWAIDMADVYPEAHVLGTDLSPIQPDFVPPNCEFEVDDVTSEWTFPENHFDFIHLREMFGSIADWDELFAQAFRHTKPGGWVEIVEHSVEPTCDDGTMPPGHFYEEWGRTVITCGETAGKSFRIWKEAKGYMERAGFVEIHEVRYRWPMNGWSSDPMQKEIGRWNQLRLHDGIEGFMLRLLTRVLGWSYERSQVFLATMRNAVKDYRVHAYLEGTVVYGRKPLTFGH